MIRRLTENDIPQVISVSSSVDMGESWVQESLQSEFKFSENIAYFDGHTLVSFIFYRPVDDAIEINWLATAPAYSRQGHMKRLFASLIDAHRQAKAIWLEVHEKNTVAIAFYCHLGFKVTGERKKYYRDGANALLMTLNLSPGLA